MAKVLKKISKGLGWFAESMLMGTLVLVVGVIVAYFLYKIGIWKEPWITIKYIGTLFMVV